MIKIIVFLSVLVLAVLSFLVHPLLAIYFIVSIFTVSYLFSPAHAEFGKINWFFFFVCRSIGLTFLNILIIASCNLIFHEQSALGKYEHFMQSSEYKEKHEIFAKNFTLKNISRSNTIKQKRLSTEN